MASCRRFWTNNPPLLDKTISDSLLKNIWHNFPIVYMRLDGCIPFFLQNCWLIFGCCTVPGCHPTSTGQKNVSRQPAQSFGGLGMDAAVLPNWIFRRSRNHKERWKGSFFCWTIGGHFSRSCQGWRPNVFHIFWGFTRSVSVTASFCRRKSRVERPAKPRNIYESLGHVLSPRQIPWQTDERIKCLAVVLLVRYLQK